MHEGKCPRVWLSLMTHPRQKAIDKCTELFSSYIKCISTSPIACEVVVYFVQLKPEFD
jgi:hypothetical protein